MAGRVAAFDRNRSDTDWCFFGDNQRDRPNAGTVVLDYARLGAEIAAQSLAILVQEDKGDAILFYQLTATKDGLITGTFSNALTGETAPVTGSIDRASQRIAFHTGEQSENVIECNLHGLTKGQTGVFVHFGSGQTQEWLLVRMENPDMLPMPVTIPAASPK